MIVIGCVSVISGVAVAYLHNKNQTTSDPVSPWVGKLIRTFRIIKLKTTQEKSHNNTPYEMQVDGKEGITKSSVSSDGNNIDNNTKMSISNDITGCNGDRVPCLITWIEVARALDRFMMIVCLCLTLMSLITTVTLFIVS